MRDAARRHPAAGWQARRGMDLPTAPAACADAAVWWRGVDGVYSAGRTCRRIGHPTRLRDPVKLPRHAAILELIRTRRVPSQEALRELLAERGIEVAQATLSRDIRTLGLVKAPDGQGGSAYAIPAGGADTSPTLGRLLPALYVGADGVGNLLVLKTLVGGAQPIAVALDAEGWPEIVGTLGGDDTILIILRSEEHREKIVARIEAIADRRGD